MKAEQNSMTGGIIMLCSLVIMLTIPMIIGHYTLAAPAPAPIQVSAVTAQ